MCFKTEYLVHLLFFSVFKCILRGTFGNYLFVMQKLCVIVECVMVKGKTRKNKEENRDERCPMCQVPLSLLAKHSRHHHVVACLSVSTADLPGLMFFSHGYL